MEVFLNLDDVPRDFGPTILSVGNFDGVHLAHTRVLREIARRGVAQGAHSLAVTFDPHPMRTLRPESGLKLITPTSDKLRLLSATEIDATLVLPFTSELSSVMPEDFVRDILKNRLHAIEIHEGYNFRFGNKASGDVGLLERLGRTMKFDVRLYPEMRVHNDPVSSTQIRNLLNAGEVGRARRLLGRPFSVHSSSAPGRGYGSTQTVPTINLAPYKELVPKDGVYVTRTVVGSECFDSVTNVGGRPTFGEYSFAIESHLLNFHSMNITSETDIEVHFLKRLRGEIKFVSVEELREQIGRDVTRAKRYFTLLTRNFKAAAGVNQVSSHLP